MNKQVKQIFSDIYNEIMRYEATVAAVLSGYEHDLGFAKAESAKYKDETRELSNRKSRLVSAARSEIKKEDKALHDAVTSDSIPKLKKELSAYVCGRADRQYVEVLRDFMDFGLKLTRPELDALILQADGSYTGLKMLAAVAEKSGFKMTTPSVDRFMEEIGEIENAVRVPLLWAPRDHLGAAADVMEDKPIRRPDGTVAGSYGRPDTTSLLMSSMGLNQLCKTILETGERWATSFVPEISEFEPVQTEDGEITPEQQHIQAVQEANAQTVVEDTSAVDWARERAAKRAESDAQAAAAMEKFML